MTKTSEWRSSENVFSYQEPLPARGQSGIGIRSYIKKKSSDTFFSNPEKLNPGVLFSLAMIRGKHPCILQRTTRQTYNCQVNQETRAGLKRSAVEGLLTLISHAPCTVCPSEQRALTSFAQRRSKSRRKTFQNLVQPLPSPTAGNE